MSEAQPRARRGWRRALRVVRATTLAAIVLAAGVVGESPAADRWIDSPVRVRILLGDGGALTDRSTLLEDLRSRLVGAAGPAWELTIEPASQSPASVARFTVADGALRGTGYDKLILVAVERGQSRGRVLAREYDVETADLGQPLIYTVLDMRLLPAELAGLIRDVFRPVVRVDVSRAGDLWLVPRAGNPSGMAGGFGAGNGTGGELYEVHYRFLGKTGRVEQRQVAPWTFVVAERWTAGGARGRVESGLRAPLTARRQRVEVLGLAVKPLAAETTVLLRPGSRNGQPAAGLEVRRLSRDGNTERRETLVSDRQGRVVLKSRASRPGGERGGLERLEVVSGNAVLARVPLVVGLHAEEILPLPDDSLRLAVEADIVVLQSNLMDTVARRAVIISQVRLHMKQGAWDRVDPLLKQLGELQSAQSFRRELDEIRLPALQAARSTRDIASETRIERMCAAGRDLIGRYLAEEPIRQLKEEIAELKGAAAEAAEVLKNDAPAGDKAER